MSPRIKWGLVTGAVIVVLNFCGGALIGALNNCFSVITVIIASAIAGYLCARSENLLRKQRKLELSPALLWED